MTSRSFHRRALPLLLCAGLLTLGASAAPAQKARASRAATPAAFSLLDQAWSFLQSLWTDTGCRIDPDGRCLTGTTQVPPLRNLWGAEGCRLDPDGRCLAGTTQAPTLRNLRGAEGCRIDPSGRCVTGTLQVPRASSDTDNGCRIDPNGICRN